MSALRFCLHSTLADGPLFSSFIAHSLLLCAQDEAKNTSVLKLNFETQ
jgi:hypothetical protein